jgi:hypothetical protein
VDRDAMKVCEYVRRGRVVVRWTPTDQNWADIFTMAGLGNNPVQVLST